MNENPFATPKATLGGKGQASGSILWAILAGGIVDFGATFVLANLISVFYGATNVTPDMVTDEDFQKLIEALSRDLTHFDNVWGWSALVLGLSCSIAGGYVCAAVARGKLKPAVAILAGLMFGYGIYFGGETYEFGMNIVLSAVTAGAIYLGARI